MIIVNGEVTQNQSVIHLNEINRYQNQPVSFHQKTNRYIRKMNAMITLLKDDKHEKLLSIGNKIKMETSSTPKGNVRSRDLMTSP